MIDVGVVLPDEQADASMAETIDIAVTAESAGFHSIWKSEAHGSNAMATLGAVARETTDVHLGTGIVNVFTRTPTLLAMSAATLNELADGRLLLGIGASTEAIVEELHGVEFDRPLLRTRETIEIIESLYNSGHAEYDGHIFEVDFPSKEYLRRNQVSVYNAAMGEQNVQLTGEYADGWIPAYLPRFALDDYVDDLVMAAERGGRDPDEICVAPFVPTALADNSSEAELQVREFLASKMAVGYEELMRTFGYDDTVGEAAALWRQGKYERAKRTLPQEFVDQVSVYGTPTECFEGIQRYEELGVDLFVMLLPFSADVSTVDAMLRKLGDRL